MFILNQVVGIGDFSIMDNFRLIVIAAIFIGIVVVLLYLRSGRSGRKRERRHVHATNSHDGGSEEEIHSADVDDFLNIEEEIKSEKDEVAEDLSDSEVEIEEVSAVDIDKELADIENMEGESGVTQEADKKKIKADFAAIIEGLISKIEEREKEVVNKVENVVDAKVQEVLSNLNERIDDVIQAQKNSTALVLEKMINSLRQKEETLFNKILEAIDGRHATSETLDTLPIEEEPVDTSSSKKKTWSKDKKAAKEKPAVNDKQVVKKEPLAKKTSVSSKKPAAVESKSIPSEPLDTLPIEEEPVGIKSSKKSKQSKKEVDKKVEFEEITKSDSEAVAEGPEKRKKEGWEMLSEAKEYVKAEEEEPITLSEKIEKNSSGESDDLGILDFLKEDSIDISLPDESNAKEEITASPEEIKKEPLIKPSGVKEGAKVEEKEENILVDDTDSADFDIEEFLEELGNLPSEKDPESEKR